MGKKLELQYDLRLEELPGCCGVLVAFCYEVRRPNLDFQRRYTDLVDTAAEREPDHDFIVAGWREELSGLLCSARGRAVIFSFATCYPGGRYMNEALMDAVCEHPGAIECGTHVNPGTGNTVRVLMIYPTKKGKK